MDLKESPSVPRAYIFFQMLKMMNDDHKFQVFFQSKLCFLKHIYLYYNRITTGKIVFD